MVKSVGSGPERLLFERSSNLRSCTRLREAGSVPVSLLLLKSTSCIMGILNGVQTAVGAKTKAVSDALDLAQRGMSDAVYHSDSYPCKHSKQKWKAHKTCVTYLCSEQSGTEGQILCSLPASEYAIIQLELSRSTDLMLSSTSSLQ